MQQEEAEEEQEQDKDEQDKEEDTVPGDPGVLHINIRRPYYYYRADAFWNQVGRHKSNLNLSQNCKIFPNDIEIKRKTVNETEKLDFNLAFCPTYFC